MTPDPITSAAHWLDAACGDKPIPSLLIVVGIDQGHLLDVLDLRGSTTKVLAIEPDRAMAGAFQARKDWHAWRTSGRLAHLVHPDYAGADEAWRMFPTNANDCLLMVNPRFREGSPEVAAAARTAQKILYGVRANAAARRQLAPRYLTNVVRNIPAIAGGGDVRALTNAFQGIPAVIAAAGPSLDAAMPELQRMAGRGLLIAVDTALRPLLHAGIAPHLVVAVDPSILNARHFQALPDCSETWLIAESALDRSATMHFDERTFWLRVSKHHPWPWLNQCGIDVGQIDVWGSVLTAALQVAILAGCDPIVLVGADLAFTGGRPYCRSTTYEFDWAWSASIGRSLEQAWQHHIDSTKPRASTDLHGQETLSSGSLEAFRDWIVARAKKSGRRVINATNEGILFGDGVAQGRLASCLSSSIDLPPMGALASRARRPIDKQQIVNDLARVHQRLTSGDCSASPLAEWAEFSGDGFDAAAVAGALDEAHAALRSVTRAAVVEPDRPWTRYATPESRRVMTHLPEAMARLRIALEGETELPDIAGCSNVSEADRVALLIDALKSVGAIRDLLAGKSLPLTQQPRLVSRVPASALYEWPEAARWGVEYVEALLGTTWWAQTPRRASFFAGPIVPIREGDSPLSGPPRVAAEHVCVAIVVRWLRCMLSLGDVSSSMSPDVDRLMALESLAENTIESRSAVAETKLTVTAMAGSESCAVELLLALPESALARVLTGAIGQPGGHAAIATQLRYGPLTIRLNLSSDARKTRRSLRHRSTNLLNPQWFTDPRLHNALIAYAIEGGVVCTQMNASESVIVRPDGRVEPHHVWPRPFVSELPFGDSGAVAWGQGRVTATGREPSYIMYRGSRNDACLIEELALVPSLGAWWSGRLYLSHVGSATYPGRGIGSWAPGEPSRLEIPDLAVYDIHPDGESLGLEPRYINADKTLERRRMTESWSWRPGEALRRIRLGPYGVSSSRARGEGWTARAYPEADLVTLTADAGITITLTVYYPFRLAWVGRSLFVSSAESGLLLFRDLADELDALCRAA